MLLNAYTELHFSLRYYFQCFCLRSLFFMSHINFLDNVQVKEDTIFVSGLPETADSSQIGQFFGQIGIIKVVFSSTIQCKD